MALRHLTVRTVLSGRTLTHPSLPPLSRSLSTTPSSAAAYTIYRNPRRLRSAGMTLLAAGQASFWASAAFLSQQAPEPLIGVQWTYAGFGLSAAFAGLIVTYLRRSVAEMALVDASGPAVQVTPHGLAGLLGTPVLIPAKDLIAGPGGDDPQQRYWSFARKGPGVRLYYILDVKNGVTDEEAVKAVVKGGEHLLVYIHKRDAGIMKQRWKDWQETAGKNAAEVSGKNT